jgi:hypothetical protein
MEEQMQESEKEKRQKYRREYREKVKRRKAQYAKDHARKRKNSPWGSHLHSARKRCNRPLDKSYMRYGAKGIKCLLTNEEIKALWFRDNAAALLQPSIDRIDSSGHYEFKNCRFIEKYENCRQGWETSTKRKIARWVAEL